MFILRRSHWLVCTPFFIFAALVVLMFLHPLTGIGPANNTFAASALAAIAIGLVVGIVSLFRAKAIGIWWRLLIGVSYLPVIVFSLLSAGF